MSRNRNYQNYYRPQSELEKPIEDTEAKETIEESPASTEDVAFETVVTPTKVIQKSAAMVKGAPKVNMRSAPSKDATVIATLPENTGVLIDEHYSNEYWYLIEFNGTLGYMMRRYLKRI